MTAPHIFPAVSERSWASTGVWRFFGHCCEYLHWENFNGLGETKVSLLHRHGQWQPAATEAWLVPWSFFVSLIFQSDVVIFSISNHSCKNISFPTMIKPSGVLTRAAPKQADLKKILCSQTTGSRQFLLKHMENLPWHQQKQNPHSLSALWGLHSNYTWIIEQAQIRCYLKHILPA